MLKVTFWRLLFSIVDIVCPAFIFFLAYLLIKYLFSISLYLKNHGGIQIKIKIDCKDNVKNILERFTPTQVIPAKFHRLNFSSVPCSNGQSTLTSQKYLFLWSFNHLTFHSSVAMVTVLIRGILHYI